jgi:hypothetical protein
MKNVPRKFDSMHLSNPEHHMLYEVADLFLIMEWQNIQTQVSSQVILSSHIF